MPRSTMKKHGDLSPRNTFSPVGKNADVDYGHSNHIAAALGGNCSDSGGLYRGVAPGAAVFAVKILDERGQDLISDVVAGIDHIIALNRQFWRIKVVNRSGAAKARPP